MPAVMNPHQTGQERTKERSPVQKVCILVGAILVMIGLSGVLMPGLLGMHLSMLHNFAHILSGSLALWVGFSAPRKAFSYSLIFGGIYCFLGIIGFLYGEPGYPTVGNMEADQNLFKVAPNFLELGTMDHIAHLIIGSFLLFTAYTFRKDRIYRSHKK